MDIVFDYQPTDRDNAAERTLLLLGPLQACFQQALGHELPNRLVAVGGLARLLLLEQAELLNEEGRSHLNRLALAVRQADEMVRTLADLGRFLLEPGPAVPVNLGELAREALAEVKVLFPRRTIEYDLAESFPALTMPQRPWLRVFSILCRHLVGSTTADCPCRIAIEGRAEDDGVSVLITDGTVRSEAQLRPLFEPFTQTGPGAGLGLFPVRLIVAGWNGRLRVRTLPEQGTQFVLAVPHSPPGSHCT